jgi:Lipocalin-like domain
MRKSISAGPAPALVAASAAHSQRATDGGGILGAWKVKTLKVTSGGEVTYPLGEHPSGFVTMTPERMWLLFVDSARETPASPTLTDAEAVAMMKSHVSWTGKYTVGEQTSDGVKITARVDAASSQAIVGTDRLYFVRVDGDKITFKSPGTIVPMTGKTSLVEFEMTRLGTGRRPRSRRSSTASPSSTSPTPSSCSASRSAGIVKLSERRAEEGDFSER